MSMHPRVQKLGQALVRANVIDAMQLASAMASAEQWGKRLGKAVVELRLAHESDVAKAFAAAANMPYVDLADETIEPGAVAKLDAQFCRESGVFPFALLDKGHTIVVAMADPSDLETLDGVSQRTRCRVKPMVAAEGQLQRAIRRYHLREDVELREEEEGIISELDELKLVDSNGRTLMIDGAVLNLNELPMPPPRAPEPPPPPRSTAPTPTRPPAVAPQRPAPPPPAPPPPAQAPSLPPEVQAALLQVSQQVAQIKQLQELNQRLIRAVADVLIEKRIVTPDELRAKLAK